MGRNVTGFHTDKKSTTVNDKSNDTICVAPKASPEKSGKIGCEAKDHNANARLSDECIQKQDVLEVKITSHQPGEKIIKADPSKSTCKKTIMQAKTASGSAFNGMIDATSFEPLKPGWKDEKQDLFANHANGAGNNNSEVFPESSGLHSSMSAKKLQPNFHLLLRKQMQPHYKNYYDEEDNWSLASSTATSVRSRVTVPVAPKFNSDNRLERRKEFYTKLEEKHKALEKEKREYESRTKEEEQAAIKQLRKNMTYKANPVPSFYREGPPPKVELKKLPVTRAKSPNLTRRKSCGDAVKSSPDNKGLCGQATRHSVGGYGEVKASPLPKKASPILKKASPLTLKSKNQSDLQRSNGPNKVKTRTHVPKETSGDSPSKEKGNEDIAV